MKRPDGMLRKLNEAGFEAYYVGGCVRDTLLGRPIHDWDITTSALPEEIMRVFSRCIPTGVKHGTVTVIEGDTMAEVTTFRRDGAYHDGRHPERVLFVPNLKEDLARRDFTVNAMAMDEAGRITDLFGGREDLENRIIRCVGEPDKRFQEDALRMLRALRFSAQLGFTIEEETFAAIGRNAGLCRALSRERVREETEKTLLSDRPEVLGTMLSLGLLAACGAEGDYDLRALRKVPAQPEARWAMAKVLTPALPLEQFRLPSKLLRTANSAAAAYRERYTRPELKRLIAEEGRDTAQVCALLSGQAALFSEIEASGECVSLKELRVTGRDFPALHGKAVGRTLHALLSHVLSHPEDNDRQTLLRLAEEGMFEPSNVDGDDHIGDVQGQHDNAL